MKWGSSIKSIQRGTYAGAGGTVTINAVVIAKSLVLSKSKGSAGYVAVRADVTGTLSPSGITGMTGSNGGDPSTTYNPTYSGTRSLSGGTTALTAKVYSAVLTDTTTLTCDGPVEWQVVEYN